MTCSGDDLRDRVNTNMARRLEREHLHESSPDPEYCFRSLKAQKAFLLRFITQLVHDANSTPEEKDLDADTLP